MEEEERWCFCWAPDGSAGGVDRAALLKANAWSSGDTISVSFLDGDEGVQKKVRQFAKQWTAEAGGPANLTLEFRTDTTQTDIRISFKYKGSWSVLGTACKQVPKPQPTMNFGWLKPTSTEDEVRRVVLHEFGHALGLIHEHQSPQGGIQWNEAVVRASLKGPPNNWTEDQIQTNMFQKYEEAALALTGLDKDSIMMYPFPATWTKNGFSSTLNSKLSDKDIELINEQYR